MDFRAPLAVLALALPVAWGQPLAPDQDAPRSMWWIPNLAYGPASWSVLKLTNPSNSNREVRVEVYRDDGIRLPIGPGFLLQAMETRQIRIEDPKAAATFGSWARIVDESWTLTPPLAVTAAVEMLTGNDLKDFPRVPWQPSTAGLWVSPAKGVRGRQLYFANVSDRASWITFCVTDSANPKSCGHGSNKTTVLQVKPNQVIIATIGKLRKRYFITESDPAGPAMVGLLVPAQGVTRTFTSNSSISFGDPEK